MGYSGFLQRSPVLCELIPAFSPLLSFLPLMFQCSYCKLKGHEESKMHHCSCLRSDDALSMLVLTCMLGLGRLLSHGSSPTPLTLLPAVPQYPQRTVSSLLHHFFHPISDHPQLHSHYQHTPEHTATATVSHAENHTNQSKHTIKST